MSARKPSRRTRKRGEPASPTMHAAFARLREIGSHGLRKQTADRARDTAIVASSPRRLVEKEWRGDDSLRNCDHGDRQ